MKKIIKKKNPRRILLRKNKISTKSYGVKSTANYRIWKIFYSHINHDKTFFQKANILRIYSLLKLSNYQDYLLIKNIKNKILKRLHKQKLNSYDKVFYYYKIKIPISLYCHKVFILLEIQLNTILAKTKLVPYLFISEDLCFYRLVWVNETLVSSPYFLIGLFDTIRIPIYLYNYIHHQNPQNQHYPKVIGNFFKSYWQYIINFSQSKVWLLNNYIMSTVTGEALIFDYPNLLLYHAPFIRFAKIYYRNKPNTPIHEAFSTYSHLALKITLFNYISFYK